MVGPVQVEPEEMRENAVSPVGDFIAVVGGFVAALFAIALNWYTPAQSVASAEKSLRGTTPQNPAGVICFVIGAVVFAFGIVVLIGRFINPNFRLMRSPGWVYATAATIVFIACITALVVPPNIAGVQAGISAGPILELFAAIAIGVAGLLKF